MPYIVATDSTLFWAVGTPIIETGVALPGELTVSGLPMISAPTENEFLGLAAGKAVGYKPLPASGWLEAGEIYAYGSGLVIVRQSHARTEHAPADVPALFCVYRPEATGDAAILGWVAGEKVEKGMRRRYNNKLYRCLQAHVTQADWSPDKTPALWGEIQTGTPIPDWKQPTGAHDAYNKGNRVRYKGNIYESLINANVWAPDVYPPGWKLIGPA